MNHITLLLILKITPIVSVPDSEKDRDINLKDIDRT